MSIEELELNECNGLSFSDWLRNDQVVKFQNEVEERLLRFLFSSDPNDPQFFQTIQSLATVGCSPSERALLERDILAFNELEAVPCGLFRNIGRASAKIARFIANHKKEIFVGAGLCATGLGIAAVTGYACTAVIGGVAVAGAGSIFSKKEENKKQPNIPNPASKQEIALANTSPFLALPKLELPSTPNEFLVTSDGIWANGEFYSTPDLLEKPHVKETFNSWAISYEKPLQLDPSTLTAYDSPTRPLEKFLGQSQLPNLETERRPLNEKSHPKETCCSGPIPSTPTDNFGYSIIPDIELMKQQMLAEFREYGGFPEDFLVMGDVQPARSKAFSVVGIHESRCQIGWINGINNTYAESKTSARYIRELAGGHAVSGVYNCTHGAVIDILEAGFLNYLGCSPNTAKLLENQWKTFHENNLDKPHAKLLQICHSQGAIDVKNALKNSPPEIRDRIIVLAIAPAAIVPKRLCFESKNYASEKDIIYKLEPTRTSAIPLRVDSIAVPSLGESIDDRGELIILKAHPDAKWIDHEFQSLTYKPVLERVLTKYEECGGEFKQDEREVL